MINTDKTETTKLSANDAITLMIKSINQDSKEDFYKVAEKYCSTFVTGSNVAYTIKRAINEKPQRLISLNDLNADLKKLLQPDNSVNDNVYLNPETQNIITEILTEWQNADVYKFHNLTIRNKILLHGPTGNGKTTIARYIAQQSNLPFVQINSDYVIDSHLGRSSTNINKIFNDIKEPCVLFWDEVDTIGRKRGLGTNSAVGMENERMVNSILVNIEKLANTVIFIGATNRKEILDSAFLRRFDILWELPNPTDQEKTAFANQMLAYYKLPQSYMVPVNNFSNFSEIKNHFTQQARKHVLSQLKNNS